MTPPRIDVRALGARLSLLAWLTLVWLLLWGFQDPGTVLAGLAVAIGVTVLLPLPRVPVEGRLHPLSTIRLGVTLAWYMVRSSLEVAWLSVRPAPAPHAEVMRAPLRLRSDFLLVLAVNSLNLMPGGIVVRIDPVHREVHVHVLDAGSPRARDSFHRQVATIERLFIRAFERPEDWRPAPDPYADRSDDLDEENW